MPANLQTYLQTPINGFSNGNDKQSLAVWVHGKFLGITQVLALSATAIASSAWSNSNGDPVQIRVYGSQAFYAAVGLSSVASSASTPFAASAQEIIAVPSGQAISVVQAGSGGNVWLTSVS